MAVINEKDLYRIIKSKKASGSFCICGSDCYGVERAKNALVASIVAKGDETCNLHEFEGKNIDVEGICDACEALPMFAPVLCVTVRDLDLDSERLAAPRLDMLINTVENLPETTVLIFYTPNADIFGGTKYVTAKNKKLTDAVTKHGSFCNIPVKTGAQAVKMIMDRAKNIGCIIDEQAADFLFSRCLGSLNAVFNELDKLSAYAAGTPVTIDMITLITPEESDAKGYQLADAVTAGNAQRALEIYNELTEAREEPVYLSYILMGSMNDIYRARLAIDANKGVSDVMNDFGYAKNLELRVKNSFACARKTDLKSLRRCLAILSDADLKMKSGSGSPEIVLEKAIVDMIMGQRQ